MFGQLRKKPSMIKKLPEPHETQWKWIKKEEHVMLSAGQYRLTEKGHK